MNNNQTKCQTLAVLSGKGGSGKTVLTLSMAKVLSEAGLRVLLVDCDVATHGGTYFFEQEIGKPTEKSLSLSDLIRKKDIGLGIPFSSSYGFDFLPSALDTMQSDRAMESTLDLEDSQIDANLNNLLNKYDVALFDCHAGYSKLVKWVSNTSGKKLIVLEPDGISSSALRALSVQLGSSLRAFDTYQVFNKLTEDERPIYEKMTGGTLFTNLPPIPFDWDVRASFATRSIPSVLQKSSAFGLGVLRLMKSLFPDSKKVLDKIEASAVGSWFSEIKDNLEQLENEKKDLKRKIALRNTWYSSMPQMVLALLAVTFGFLWVMVSRDIFPMDFLFGFKDPKGILVGLISVSVGMFSFLFSYIRLKHKRTESKELERLETLDIETERFRTLITTDPRLREYQRYKSTDSEVAQPINSADAKSRAAD